MILFLVFLLTVIYYFYFHFSIKKNWGNDVPFDYPIPIFGNMLQKTLIGENFVTVLYKKYQKFSSSRYFGFFNFITPVLVIKDPDLIRRITVSDFESFSSHSIWVNEELEPLWAKNLFAIQDLEKWRQLRTKLTPSFTSNKLKGMFELMEQCAKNFVSHYMQKEGEVIEVDLKDAFRRYANDVIASTAFGISCDSLKNIENDFFLMGQDLCDLSGMRAFIFFLYNSCPILSTILRMKLLSGKASSFFKQIIEDNIRMRESQKIVRFDMIHLLLEARKGKSREELQVNGKKEGSDEALEKDKIIKKDSEWITDEDIVAQALVFFFAGFDSTSTVMSFAGAELAINPDIQAKLFNDILKVYEQSGGNPKYEDIQQMKYLDMVISESSRKWPTEIFLDRKVTKPWVIKADNGADSVKLNKGDTIWIPSYSIHRDPNYFPNPENFDPERFSDERKAEIKPFTFLTFGSGPRNCIGSRFAILEIKIALFYILLNFEIIPTANTKLPIKISTSQLLPQIEEGSTFGLRKRANNYQQRAH